MREGSKRPASRPRPGSRLGPAAGRAVRQRRAELEAIAQLKKEWGSVPASYQTLLRYAPETFLAVVAMRRGAFEEGELPKKVKELVRLGISAAMRLPDPFPQTQARRALEAGATLGEIHETLEIALITAGFSSYSGFGQAAMKYAEDHEKARKKSRG